MRLSTSNPHPILLLAFSSPCHLLQVHAWNVEDYQRHQARGDWDGNKSQSSGVVLKQATLLAAVRLLYRLGITIASSLVRDGSVLAVGQTLAYSKDAVNNDSVNALLHLQLCRY